MKEEKKINNIYTKNLKETEIFVWMIIAAAYSFPIIFDLIGDGGSLKYLLEEGYYKILTSVFIFTFPLLFKLIFEEFPFEFFRKKRLNDKYKFIIESKTAEENEKNLEQKQEDEHFYLDYINEAKEISGKIYGRSGAYLLVGCLIAFCGVLFFYFPFMEESSFNNQESFSITLRLVNYIPRFGALFFLEFIAFFFLRQHRIMMEEFRYYEKVKRRRQDNYSILNIIEKFEGNEKKLSMVLEHCAFEELNDKILKEETTEILETQKITNSENAIFEKLVDLVQAIKK